jgi:solute carrier family 25 (mitochondrial phosphate transporter), member 23/24/25/41
MYLERFLHAKGQTDLTPLQRLIPGGLAGITALVATYPLELVRARLTVQKGRYYTGMWDCLVKVSRQEGPLQLFRGLWPSIVGVVPYVGIDFAAYETFKQYTPKRPDGTVGAVSTLINGALAGTLAQTGSLRF